MFHGGFLDLDSELRNRLGMAVYCQASKRRLRQRRNKDAGIIYVA